MRLREDCIAKIPFISPSREEFERLVHRFGGCWIGQHLVFVTPRLRARFEEELDRHMKGPNQ